MFVKVTKSSPRRYVKLVESYRLKDKRRAGLVTTPTTKEDEPSHDPEPVPMKEH